MHGLFSLLLKAFSNELAIALSLNLLLLQLSSLLLQLLLFVHVEELLLVASLFFHLAILLRNVRVVLQFVVNVPVSHVGLNVDHPVWV